MSQSNRFFRNPERAPNELSNLLRSLPEHLADIVSAEEQAMLMAAEQHATNYTDTVLTGLEALGHVMWSAGVNAQQPIDAKHFARVGLLVTELAVQLQFLDDFRMEVAEHTLDNARKGTRK